MVRILVPTIVNDVHAIAVDIALARKGHEAVLWHGADFPTRQNTSVAISADQAFSWQIDGPGLSLNRDDFDVVWFRRPVSPVFPDDLDLDPSDRYIAERESLALARSIWPLVGRHAFWVNPLEGRARAKHKTIQLKEAIACGLRVPPTLCSNDPERIRRFVRESPGETIYKSFAPAQWRIDGGSALVFTSLVTEDDLPDDDILRLSPGILQRRIAKDHEIRVTYMGDHAVTVRLLSQESEATRLDWKASFNRIALEKAALPAEIDEACRRLMRRLGIVFGCLDLIVTPGGEHVFLEVNEMGQFLWLESMDPEILTLDPFCEFLVQGKADFRWRPSRESVRFADVLAEAERRMAEGERLHVSPPRDGVADETPEAGPGGGVRVAAAASR